MKERFMKENVQKRTFLNFSKWKVKIYVNIFPSKAEKNVIKHIVDKCQEMFESCKIKGP